MLVLDVDAHMAPDLYDHGVGIQGLITICKAVSIHTDNYNSRIMTKHAHVLVESLVLVLITQFFR